MKFALLVAWREYAENAKTKGFWLGILLVPVIIFLSVQIPIFLEMKGTPTRYYVLVDQSGKLEPVVESPLAAEHERTVLNAMNDYLRKFSATNLAPLSAGQLKAAGGTAGYLEQIKPALRVGAPPFKSPRRAFQRVQLPAEISATEGLSALAQNLRPYLRGDKQLDVDGQRISLHAAILIPPALEQIVVRPRNQPCKTNSPLSIEYWSGNLADTKLRDEIERTINAEVRRWEYSLRGLDAGAVREVEQTYAPIASLNPQKEAGQEAVNSTDVIRQWAPSAFVYLLWVAIFAIVQMLLNNIIEEKSNRIIEVLLSSVTPGELMMGKLFGIAAVGLTMVGSWMLALFVILTFKTSGGAVAVTGPILTVLRSSHLVPMFGVYFVFGYLMYAALILALGSVCNTLKEAQSYMGVITMVMMVPLMTMTFIPKDPNGVLARVLSWIPLYTPFIMMNRVMADPPWFDVIGTLLLLLLSTAGALWLAGKVFRIGILRTGQPPKLLEMLRWLKR